MHKCVAIIPARGGSKRIPRKNIKDFFGKPLIAYSIQNAIDADIFDKIIVSTDDEEVATVAKKYGALVPFIRPKHLSDDYTTVQSVVRHAVEWMKSAGAEYDFCCTIYATAPLLQVKYLEKALVALKKSDAVNAFSAAAMPFPVKRTFKITDGGRCEMFWPENYNTRSQDLEEAYQDAGQFYWTNLHKKVYNKIMFSDISIPIVLPRFLVQDIDTLEDWKNAELLYEILRHHGENCEKKN